jgi:hypothetical protein
MSTVSFANVKYDLKAKNKEVLSSEILQNLEYLCNFSILFTTYGKFQRFLVVPMGVNFSIACLFEILLFKNPFWRV